MRRKFAAVVVFATLALSASAAQQPTHPKFKPPAVAKTIKNILKSFGDWMSVPIP